ncbi:unnamed protein product [Periconia digitata]|uniref:Uncharacterized protein n=1 Tax=Periconia digitata TaxID=1303443 RepID=A0A9W4U7G4_9PLEO|nr:unnamed protein product [Periconia digitata]
MSSQHRILAEVWQHLEGRNDIANIVREIIGQHSLDSALQHDSSTHAEETIRTIIWLKTIFDLQRCYLSGIASGVAECPPFVSSCLLPHELLFSSILYLINVKTRFFSSQTTLMTKEFTRPRHILTQTILSGLRLLLLRKQDVDPHDKRRLQNAINSAWKDDRLFGVERFVVSEIYAEVLNSLGDTSRQNPYHREWVNANLPTYAAGLYPLDMRHETFVTPLIHGTMEEDWIDAFWVLYDCLWAVECAVTQRFVDSRREIGALGSRDISADTDEALESIWQTRTSLIISMFHVKGPMTPTPGLLDSLAVVLLEWDDDIDNFLSRQDSLAQQITSARPTPPRNNSYGKVISETVPYVESALGGFAEWLSSRNLGHEQASFRKTRITSDDLQELVREWVTKITSPKGETILKELEGSQLPVYVVNCPKLHVLPKKWLEHKLRWCDKWAYEAVHENSPMVSWKEGIQCPSCQSGERIKFARLIEPFQHLSAALDNLIIDPLSLNQLNVGGSSTGSYDTTSASLASRSTSDTGSIGMSFPSSSAMNGTVSSHASRISDTNNTSQSSNHPPRYTESPISPLTMGPPSTRSQSQTSIVEYPVSPLNESLNIPIPMSVSTRLSMDLPIPVHTPPFTESAVDDAFTSISELSEDRLYTPSNDSIRSVPSFARLKSASRTVRIANSIRRKPTLRVAEPCPLPKDPAFVFSSTGHSLLLWGSDTTDHLLRFDIPSNETSAIQGCRYEVTGIEAAAAGNHRCAIVVSSGLSKRKLIVFSGTNLTSESEFDLDSSYKLTKISVCVSRNDRFVALSLNDQIQLFSLEDGIKRIPFHHQIHVHELKGGVSHTRVLSVERSMSGGGHKRSGSSNDEKSESSWLSSNSKGLSSKEKAEEQQRQAAVVSRRIYFSTDSKRLVVATQLGDHCIYVDVYDCTHEPVGTISEQSRSFKMPPWTLNDGDLTGVFYDSERRAALVTAFLGKEYPLLIPFPGYDPLQNETYSTKIINAAQSPSGATLIAVNAMTEVIQFEYTTKGHFAPRKLKKSASKISTSVFKPGAIALAMPLENLLQMFWIKDGKCMLRSVKIGVGEQFKDYDIRPHFDRLMSMQKPVIARAPSLKIPELDGT